MRTFVILLSVLPILAACGERAELRVSEEAPTSAAALAPGMETENLNEQLRKLEVELGHAVEGEPDRVLTAEAITDRLIHAERSVDWLAGGYSVQARLRQLQAMADRVVALMRRGATLESVASDVSTMRAAVEDLQRRLAMPGGGSAPAPLDSLLQQDPLRDVESASLREVLEASGREETERELPDIGPQAQPRRGGPLGTPVPPPDGPRDR